MKKKSKRNRTDLLLDKLPPQNTEAKEAMLSAILIDNSIINDVVEILCSEDFYRSKHKIIFQAMVDLFESREPVDLVTLTNQLKKSEEL